MITHCIDVVRYSIMTKKMGSDNAANQAKNNNNFSWMIDYVEEDHGLQTIQQNVTAQQHGKGTFLHSQNYGLLLCTFKIHNLGCFD